MRGKERQTSRDRPRVALAFAYDGSRFDSFARQPARRTVEGELLGVLAGAGVLDRAHDANYEVASRTDAGVSAAWNVCAFDSEADPRRLPHLPHEVPGLWLLGATTAPAGFSPRREARRKRYVYHVPDPDAYVWRSIAEAASVFVGRHDFRNFCRPDRDVPTVRTIERLDVEPGRLVFEAPNFLWEQVRRITHALLRVGRGDATTQDLRRRLEAKARREPEPAAPPEGLVLERVDLGLEFGAPSKSAVKRLRLERQTQEARARFYGLLVASLPTVRR